MNKDIRKVAELIQGIQVAMMTTVDRNGYLRSRPMMTQKHEFDGTLWFFTRSDAAKAGELSKDQRVNLSYADDDEKHYVSISGKANITREAGKIKEFWNPMYKAWFPDGIEDPTLALLKVEVDRAEYWDTHRSAMVYLIGFAKGMVTGKPYHPGENKKIDLAAS